MAFLEPRSETNQEIHRPTLAELTVSPRPDHLLFQKAVWQAIFGQERPKTQSPKSRVTQGNRF